MLAYDYTDHVVLVTGGTSGIGRAAVEDAGGTATFIPTDVGDPPQIAHLVEETVATYGRLDVAINNAAGTDGAGQATHAFEVAEFDAAVAVTLRGVWVGMKHQIQQMLAQDAHPASALQGAIVNVSSVNGLGGAPSGSIYSACKAGVLALTKSAAQEHAANGLQINALVPGAVDTPMLRTAVTQAAEAQDVPTDAVRAQYAGRTALGRIGRSSEAAAALLWLASDAASYVHGHSLIVDGGATSASR